MSNNSMPPITSRRFDVFITMLAAVTMAIPLLLVFLVLVARDSLRGLFLCKCRGEFYEKLYGPDGTFTCPKCGRWYRKETL